MNLIKHAWLYCLISTLHLTADEASQPILEELLFPETGIELITEASPKYQKPPSTPSSPQPMANPPSLRNESSHFRLNGEFIYWKRTDGIQFISNGIGFLVQEGQDSQNTAVASQGSTYFPAFNFAPGFIVGCGLSLPYDGWDVEFSYLWLQNEGDKHFTQNPAKGWENFPFFLTEVLLPMQISSAYQKARQSLNYFTLALGKEFCASKQLVLRPLVEIASLYTPASLHLSFAYDPNGPDALRIATFRTHTHGLGFGAGLGLETQWKISNNWSIEGSFKIDGIWDHFESKVKQNVDSITSGTNTQSLLGKAVFNKLLYLTNTFLGVDWHTAFRKDRSFVSIYAGWNFFSGLNNYFALSQVQIYSEMYAYQGLRTGLKFEF